MISTMHASYPHQCYIIVQEVVGRLCEARVLDELCYSIVLVFY